MLCGSNDGKTNCGKPTKCVGDCRGLHMWSRGRGTAQFIILILFLMRTPGPKVGTNLNEDDGHELSESMFVKVDE